MNVLQAAFRHWLILVALIAIARPSLAGDDLDTMAPTSFMLEGEHMIAAIHKQSGHVTGIWNARTGRQIIRDSYDTYLLENRGGTRRHRAEDAPAAVFTNADFEGGVTNGVPDGWRTTGAWEPDDYTLDPAGVTIDNTSARSGKCSVRLQKEPADKRIVGILRSFPTQPDREYVIRAHVKAEIKHGHVILAAVGEDHNGRWAALRAQHPMDGPHSSGEQWEVLEIRVTGQVEMPTVRAAVILFGEQAKGVAWVDDFTCEPVQSEGVKWEANEKEDIVRRVLVEKPDHVVLECTNAQIPDAKLVKHYYFAGTAGEKRILCRKLELSGKPDGKTLLICRSNTVFDPDFRDGSLYHYVFPQGAVGNQHPLMRAEEIRRPIARRDHGADDYGRAALDAWNPRLECGFAQYLYLANGHWEYPRGFAQTYWTNDGWQIGMSAMFINEQPVWRETRYHLFYEDRLQVHYEYMNLPEFKALRDESARRVWPRVLRCGPERRMHRPGDAWGHQMPFPFETRRYEGGYEWGQFITRDDVVMRKHDLRDPDVITAQAQGRQYRDFFHDWRRQYPRSLIGLFIYRSYEGPYTRQHPEWFGSWSRPPAYYHHRFNNEVIELLTDGLTQEAAYLNLGHVYRDAAIETGADWDLGKVWPAMHQIKYFRMLQEKAHKVGCFLWTNMRTGSVFYDAAYYEGSGATPHVGKTWRDSGDADLMSKVYQIPGTVHVPLQWWLNGPHENARRYHDLCLMLAMRDRGGACSIPQADGEYPKSPDIEPFVAVVREIMPAVFVRIGLQPAWWSDLETNLEAYTLKLGDTYLVNAISHEARTRDFAVSVDLQKMGFERGRRTFIWTHRSRQMLGPNEQYPDQLRDHQYTNRTFTTVVPQDSQLSLPFAQMPPEHVWVTTITQTPAFIFSADDIATQTLLPQTLECRISGRLDEQTRSSTLSIDARERPIRVLAYWPADWGAAEVLVNGNAVDSDSTEVGGGSFRRFDLPKGQWNVKLVPAHHEK